MAKFKVQYTDNQLIINWSHFSRDRLLEIGFIFLWLFFWSLLCALFVWGVIVKPQIKTALFAIPFFFFWFVVANWGIKSLFGKEEIRLDANGWTETLSLFFWKQSKSHPLNELLRFEYHFQNSTRGKAYFEGIRIFVHNEKDEDISIPGTENELKQLAKLLNFVLRDYKNADGFSEESITLLRKHEIASEENREIEPDVLKPKRQITISLDTSSKNIQVPKNCSWYFYSKYDRFGFQSRGEFHLPKFLFFMVFASIWNAFVWSICVVFLIRIPPDCPTQHFSATWWFLFLFLLPFIIVGSLLLYEVVQEFLRPFWVTSWTFMTHTALNKVSLCKVGKSHETQLDDWIAIQRNLYDDEGEKIWEVALIDRNDKELISIYGLSRDESRWIADVILREKKMIL